MKTVVLCSSAAFYEHVNRLAEVLEGMGFKAVVPKTARSMKKTGEYSVDAVKTWYENAEDFTKKAELMRGHFDEVAQGDMILVVNDEKHGVKGYIGSNVLLEMGLAFYLKKPIYILSDIDKEAANYEELAGMMPKILNGDIQRMEEALA